MTPQIVRTVWLGPHMHAKINLFADGSRTIAVSGPEGRGMTLNLPDAQARNFAFALLAEPDPPQPEPETT